MVLSGIEENYENLSENSWCSSQGSHWAPPTQKSDASATQHTSLKTIIIITGLLINRLKL
jgi:hypothetical protein